MNRRRLSLERLERRRLLATFAAPWPEPGDLTLSFAPDGTLASGMATSLFETLGHLPTNEWQEITLRAFQTWAVETNANIRLTTDGGQPFGTLGLKQGDPRFGDVRIGAVPLAPDVLAVADPYDAFVASTWVGDVLLNSEFPFDMNGDRLSYDLYSVMLHEAGHVFGLGHSPDPNSPMFARFEKIATGLTPEDVAAVQGVFGARQANVWEGTGGNDSWDSATRVSLLDEHDEPWMFELDGDLGAADADVFRVTLPPNVSTLAVRMESAERSVVLTRTTVLDDQGRIVARGAASGPLDNDYTLLLDGLEPGRDYFVRIEAGSEDVFGIGGYRVEFDTSWQRESGYGAEEEHVPFAPTDERLMSTTPGYVEHTYYEMYDSFTLAAPGHVYRVRSADLGPELTNVMTVVVDWETEAAYDVVIRDDVGNVVPAVIVHDGDGHLALQVPAVQSDRDYLVEVRGRLDRPLDPDEEYGFEVTVDFAQDGLHLLPLLIDQMAPRETRYATSLSVDQSQELHFVLSASDWNAPDETGVRLDILDAEGEMVATSAAADGASRTTDVLLKQGEYTLVFTRASSTVDTTLLFQLDSISLSTPLGPQLRDTARNPLDRSTPLALAQLDQYWGAVALRTSEAPNLPLHDNAVVGQRVPFVLPVAAVPPRATFASRSPANATAGDAPIWTAVGRESGIARVTLTPTNYSARDRTSVPARLRRPAVTPPNDGGDVNGGEEDPDAVGNAFANGARSALNESSASGEVGAKIARKAGDVRPYSVTRDAGHGSERSDGGKPAGAENVSSLSDGAANPGETPTSESSFGTIAARVLVLLQLGWLGAGWLIWRRRARRASPRGPQFDRARC